MEATKQQKDENNVRIKINEEETADNVAELEKFEKQFCFTPQTESMLKGWVSEQALETIKQIFGKTQTIREVANVKHQEIQSQFKELRDRLARSSECLTRMKKGINNVKFSYQTELFELHHTLHNPEDETGAPPSLTKEEIAKKVDEIRDKIEKIQTEVYKKKARHETVIKDYQEAFDKVTSTLQSIDHGDYSSVPIPSVKSTE